MNTKKIVCNKINNSDLEGQIRRSIVQSEEIVRKELYNKLINSPLTIEEKIIKFSTLKFNSLN